MEGNCDLQVKTATRHSGGGTPLGKPPRFVVARQRPRTGIAHNLACDYAALLGLVSRCRACVDSSGADVVKYADDESRNGD